MPQRIDVPGVGLVEFPDGMSDEQIAAAIQKNLPKEVSPKLEETKGGALGEAARIGGTSLYEGATTLPRLLATLSEPLEGIKKKFIPGYADVVAGSAQAIGSADKTIKEFLTPETRGGQALGRIGGATVGAMLSPGMLTNPGTLAAVGLGSGLGAEGAAAVASDNALTRTVGGLLGGLAGGLATAAKTNRGALAREALEGVDEASLRTAQQRMRDAEAAGIPINLSQAMPRDSNIDSVIEALATSRHGKQTIEQLRNQPAQIARTGQGTVRNLPGEVLPNRILSNEGQEAATAAIRQGMKRASQEWQRYAPIDAKVSDASLDALDKALDYGAKQFAPSTSEYQLYQEVRKAIRMPGTQQGGSPILGPNGQLVNPPTQGPRYVNDALMLKGAVDDALENFGARYLNTPNVKAKDLRQAQEIRGMLRDVFQRESPDLLRANEAYSRVMTDVVNPMKKSITGDIAGRTGAQADVNAPQGKLFALFDRGTAYVPGQAKRSEILTLERDLRSAGQEETFINAGKTWIADRFAKALGPGEPGSRAPEQIAANLLKVFGDPRSLKAGTPSVQAQGLDDVLAGMARAQGVSDAAYVKGFKNFMQIVTDAARRPGTPRGAGPQELKEMASEGLTRRLGQFSIMTPIRQPALRWARFLEQDALGTMDKLMTSPEGIDTLLKLAKAPAYSKTALTAVGTFLGTSASVENTPDFTQK